MKDRAREPAVAESERAPVGSEQARPPGVTDAGRTGGGGSLGHVQPDNIQREAPLRNNAEHRESDEPTLPSKGSTKSD